MRKSLTGGVSLLGLTVIVACTYTVETPSEESSPGVTSQQNAAPAGQPEMTHEMHPMMPPHGGMMEGMSTHGMQPPSRTIPIGSGLQLEAPEAWTPVAPALGMIQNEFAVPAVEDDPADGRVTVMSAGGSVEENIQRWIGQFTQPDGSPTADKAKVESLTVAGHNGRLVDISGTYHESRGMMGPSVERPDYRMLAAIISVEGGNYFVKFYGPKKTVDSQADAFREMIESPGTSSP